MKVIDNGHFTTLELETQSGQDNFRASLKADISGDRRTWQRDPETAQLNQHMADNQTQIVVKCGELYSKVR
jgi:hypothetical protein